MDKKHVFEKLLDYGLFPERLESIFSSRSLGEWLRNNNNKINKYTKKPTALMIYRLTRNNNSPRQLGIPYPLNYYTLCEQIYNHWEEIESKLELSNNKNKSMIIPKIDNHNNRLISMDQYDQNPKKEELQVQKQFGKKYFVHADIATFYPSIYTHSIGWALVGKKRAKTNKNNKRKWYNELDTAYRNIQDQETKGLPIGPDSSALIAEVILAQVDNDLKDYEYIRFIDDYKCYCETKEEADRFINDLSRALDNYRLMINTKKTKVIPLPRAINEDWVRKLRQAIDWEEVGTRSKNKVLGFLDLASDLFRENPDESSIRYAVKTLRKKKYQKYSIYQLILNYVLNLCFLYPYIIDLLDAFIDQGLNRFSERDDEMKELLSDKLQEILIEHAKYRRSDVGTWCLFFGLKYDLRFSKSKEICRIIHDADDCIPSILCYLYLKSRREDVSIFLDLLKKRYLEEWWLFHYEVSRLESLDIKDDFLNDIRQNNITFLSEEVCEKL